MANSRADLQGCNPDPALYGFCANGCLRVRTQVSHLSPVEGSNDSAGSAGPKENGKGAPAVGGSQKPPATAIVAFPPMA